MYQRKCKICGETKDILEFRVANPDRGYIVYKCKECESAYNKIKGKIYRDKVRGFVKPKKELTEKEVRVKKYNKKYKDKLKDKKLKIDWLEDLYQYIKERNLFTDDELVVIYAWLKMVDKIGGI